MLAILKKEINSFFASPVGYLVIALFLLCNGLLLWVFKGEFNILDNGFADLTPFFTLAPWVLLFLIAAVTMRSFSDEKKLGTLELLLTKPISHLQIVLGKYFGAFTLIVIALIPTLLYVYTVYQLGNPIGNVDMASIFGSYLGLLFLIAAYTAIGVFASTLSNNQIVAFIIAIVLCLLFYIGFDGIADVLKIAAIENLGMSKHFKSIGRGVIDTRDVLYFLSVTVFFIVLTVIQLARIRTPKINWKLAAGIPILLIVLNLLGNSVFKRFDLTHDQRYTLNPATLDILSNVKTPIIVDVFLDGQINRDFRRLQDETRQLLEEFEAYNSNIKFTFINPLEDEERRESNIQQLSKRGLTPLQITVKESGKTNQELVFPWALASYDGQTVKISLAKRNIGEQDALVSNSVQNLEYAFADGFGKLVYPKRRKIAVLRGNGQLENKYIADFITTIRDYYYIAPFTLDSVSNKAESTLKKLNEFDLVINAKPTQAFSESEKYVLDQYTMNGGKSLWLIDGVAMDKDSLYANNGKAIATELNLNLTNFFFKYGLRITPNLVGSLYSAPITLAIGEGSNSQFQPIQWPYSPLASSSSKHPIVTNLNLVKFDFTSRIDTLKNPVKQTILLESAPLSKIDGMPREIDLDIITKQPDPKRYNKGSQPLAVLLEGQFTSVYNNRVKPFTLKNDITSSKPTKMIVIADGDVIKNDVGRNGPQELGFDRWTGQSYGNKEFLLNAINYLLDDSGLINIRSKDISIPYLDSEKITAQKTQWQSLNIALPLVLLGVFGLAFNYFRKKRYAK